MPARYLVGSELQSHFIQSPHNCACSVRRGRGIISAFQSRSSRVAKNLRQVFGILAQRKIRRRKHPHVTLARDESDGRAEAALSPTFVQQDRSLLDRARRRGENTEVNRHFRLHREIGQRFGQRCRARAAEEKIRIVNVIRGLRAGRSLGAATARRARKKRRASCLTKSFFISLPRSLCARAFSFPRSVARRSVRSHRSNLSLRTRAALPSTRQAKLLPEQIFPNHNQPSDRRRH